MKNINLIYELFRLNLEQITKYAQSSKLIITAKWKQQKWTIQSRNNSQERKQPYWQPSDITELY